MRLRQELLLRIHSQPFAQGIKQLHEFVGVTVDVTNQIVHVPSVSLPCPSLLAEQPLATGI